MRKNYCWRGTVVFSILDYIGYSFLVNIKLISETHYNLQHLDYSFFTFLAMLLSIKLNVPSVIRPIPTHLGHGPAVFPERVIFDPSIDIPEEKELLQLSQIADNIGI